MRPLWIALFAVVVLASSVIVLVELDEPDLVPVARPPGAVTIVGELTLSQNVLVPDTVTARATISADRDTVLPALVVRVRDEAGTYHDFPHRTDVALGTTPREITFRRELEPGVYTYCLAHRVDGEWVDLPPWQTVTIR